MTTPALSVVMSVFNAERYVAAAVESILAQTYSDFEFLIIDDGSTDQSPSILRHFAGRDERIRLIARPHTGGVVAMNELLGVARGEFLARMDHDDISLPGRFEAQVRYLQETPSCVAVGSRILLIDADGDPLCVWKQPLTHEDIDRAHVSGVGGAMGHPATMFRTSAVREVGGYRADWEWAEDLNLYLRLAEIGRLANLPDIHFHYRRHPNAIGIAHSDLQRRHILNVVNEARTRRGIGGDLPDVPVPPLTSAETHRMWAWWALADGHIPSARKHARAALRLSPWSPQSWKATYCAYREKNIPALPFDPAF